MFYLFAVHRSAAAEVSFHALLEKPLRALPQNVWLPAGGLARRQRRALCRNVVRCQNRGSRASQEMGRQSHPGLPHVSMAKCLTPCHSTGYRRLAPSFCPCLSCPKRVASTVLVRTS